MKLNKLALAVIATAAPLVATAGVTVSPVLLGYHYTDQAQDEQRKILTTGKQLSADPLAPANGGVALQSDLFTGAALGIELTPSTQLQVEYGLTNADAQASKQSAQDPANRFSAEQQTLSGNFLIGTEQFSGYTDSKFKPYVLVGAGQSKIKVENRQAYVANATNAAVQTGSVVPAGTQVTESKDTIGNLGLGARYLINDALALRGEARAVHNFDNKWWEGLALTGLEVTLGGRLTPTVPVPPVAEPPVYVPPVVVPVAPPAVVPVTPPPVVRPVEPVVIVETQPVVVDSDMDGVPDHLDACPGTPRNVVVDARGCPVQVEVEDQLRLELRVFFDNDKSAIKPQYRSEIAKVAEAMREYPNATAVIEGHASKTGPSARYNQRLSEARANAVKSMLSNEFGVAHNRLSAIGYGYDRPIAPNDTEEGRALNRRVFAVIEGNKTRVVDQTTDMQLR